MIRIFCLILITMLMDSSGLALAADAACATLDKGLNVKLPCVTNGTKTWSANLGAVKNSDGTLSGFDLKSYNLLDNNYITLVLNQGVPKVDMLTTKVGDDLEAVIIFTAPLTTLENELVGELAGFLTILDTDNSQQVDETRFRNLAFMLKDGQIIANGAGEYTSSLTEMPVERPSIIAIIGGTGKYMGARGEVETRKNADGTYRHIFKLLK
ncbi:MAG TPA: hypothetical protein EYQ43_09305 [Methyloprofundus sp.]|nr:hypothetical protein [Methyloprofundus sp.]